MQVKYEVYSRCIRNDKSDLPRHWLELLYRGEGTPWWHVGGGMNLPVAPDSDIKPGDFVIVTVERVKP